eukprot:CAMPEP_0169413068 /NCGR_PEP_ID=MMETSP1017-20121227/61158_1 /TAXON_ID=342587 /ORGANISM="Karlodinium micrum, Strain CCMP2283" /LENGTH=223 /DNA_ID=CAMNT_0009520457 /DNA_START=68 /DNA_END=735 /DNA_ORIENTATION=+
MAKQLTIVLVCLLGIAHAVNELSDSTVLDGVSVQTLAKAFSRSEQAHQESMASISRSLSLEKSVEVLEKNNKLSPTLAQVTNMVMGGNAHLRKQPKGYSGVDGAATIVFVYLLGVAHSVNELSDSTVLDGVSVQTLAKVFSRSEQAHQESMASISRSLSLEKSVEVLEKNNKLSPTLAQVTNMVMGGNAHLRKQPKGYSGVDGARKLLNDMIFEAMSKYDQEI